MVIRKVSCSYTEKRSDGNYGSREVGCFIEAELDEADNLEEKYTELYNYCRRLPIENSKRYSAEQKAKEEQKQ